MATTSKITKFAGTAIAAAGLSIGAFLGAGNASAFIGSSSVDAGFIDTLDELGIEYESTNGVIDLAHTVCDELDEGTDPDDIVATFQDANPDLSTDGAQDFVVASVQAYCPEYLS